MRDRMLKFLSSIVLFLCVVVLIFSNVIYGASTFVQNCFALCSICICLFKFLIVMILEPDSIWEIIKKFVYILILIIIVFGVIFKSRYCFIASCILVIADTLVEIRRFVRNK